MARRHEGGEDIRDRKRNKLAEVRLGTVGITRANSLMIPRPIVA
jgi:hypothetical protein